VIFLKEEVPSAKREVNSADSEMYLLAKPSFFLKIPFYKWGVSQISGCLKFAVIWYMLIFMSYFETFDQVTS
jgi:hypothetical protein